MSKCLLKLYVSGKCPKSEHTIADLRRICSDGLEGEYELQVLDLSEHPQLASEDRILATPTLIREMPGPVRRVVGDLSDVREVLRVLNLSVHGEQQTVTPNEK